jgi:hypothetical protein
MDDKKFYLGVSDEDKARGFAPHICYHTAHFQVQIGVAKEPGPEVKLAEIAFQDRLHPYIVIVGPDYVNTLINVGVEKGLDDAAADLLRQAISGAEMLRLIDDKEAAGFVLGKRDMQCQFRELLGVLLYDDPPDKIPADDLSPLVSITLERQQIQELS